MSYEKITRNQIIFRSYKQGRSFRELAKEYNLSEARIHQIVDQERYYALRGSPDIPEIELACKMLGYNSTMVSRIQTVFRFKKLGKNNRWRKLNRSDILALYGLGKKAADIIEYAKNL